MNLFMDKKKKKIERNGCFCRKFLAIWKYNVFLVSGYAVPHLVGMYMLKSR